MSICEDCCIFATYNSCLNLLSYEYERKRAWYQIMVGR